MILLTIMEGRIWIYSLLSWDGFEKIQAVSIFGMEKDQNLGCRQFISPTRCWNVRLSYANFHGWKHPVLGQCLFLWGNVPYNHVSKSMKKVSQTSKTPAILWSPSPLQKLILHQKLLSFKRNYTKSRGCQQEIQLRGAFHFICSLTRV